MKLQVICYSSSTPSDGYFFQMKIQISHYAYKAQLIPQILSGHVSYRSSVPLASSPYTQFLLETFQ